MRANAHAIGRLRSTSSSEISEVSGLKVAGNIAMGDILPIYGKNTKFQQISKKNRLPPSPAAARARRHPGLSTPVPFAAAAQIAPSA